MAGIKTKPKPAGRSGAGVRRARLLCPVPSAGGPGPEGTRALRGIPALRGPGSAGPGLTCPPEAPRHSSRRQQPQGPGMSGVLPWLLLLPPEGN